MDITTLKTETLTKVVKLDGEALKKLLLSAMALTHAQYGELKECRITFTVPQIGDQS